MHLKILPVKSPTFHVQVTEENFRSLSDHRDWLSGCTILPVTGQNASLSMCILVHARLASVWSGSGSHAATGWPLTIASLLLMPGDLSPPCGYHKRTDSFSYRWLWERLGAPLLLTLTSSGIVPNSLRNLWDSWSFRILFLTLIVTNYASGPYSVKHADQIRNLHYSLFANLLK